MSSSGALVAARAGEREADRCPESGDGGAAGAAGPPMGGVHRLRDLDRRGRLVAVLFVAALLLAPVGAFVRMAPDWAPANDPALMGLRALDVGTSRTPVSGQPSESRLYVSDVATVTHPGPLHFYALALPVRLLGAATGMLVVSVLIVAGALVLAAWAVFRQLGPAAGVLAVVVLSAITFTTGAASLVNPVSSSIAGYPLLCSMVLLWCLLCGDLRLLPLATAVVSFTAQQHLAVGPTIAVALVLVAALGWRWSSRWWPGGHDRRSVGRWVAASAAVAGVLWAPVVLQQVAGERGNLSTLVEFTRAGGRPTVGYGSALRQVAHTLGVPPLLGHQTLTGLTMLTPVGALTWASAAAVVVLTVVVGWRCRRSDPRRAALSAMAGVLLVAALVNGAAVPDGPEAGKTAFYHWVWPLLLFVALSLGLSLGGATARAFGRSGLARWRGVTPALVSLGLCAAVVPPVVNPSLSRPSNTIFAAGAPVDRRDMEELADEILDHRAALGGPTVVLERGDTNYEWLAPGLGLELIERGVDARFSEWFEQRQFIHADRSADRSTVRSGLVIVLGDGIVDDPHDVPGELVAEVTTYRFAEDDYEALVRQAEAADTVRLGDDMESALAEFGEPGAILREALSGLPDHAPDVLRDRLTLEALRDHPLEEPRLDPARLDRVARSLQADTGGRGYRLRAYLLDRAELLAYAAPDELGP
jgi:hypothetical protein